MCISFTYEIKIDRCIFHFKIFVMINPNPSTNLASDWHVNTKFVPNINMNYITPYEFFFKHLKLKTILSNIMEEFHRPTIEHLNHHQWEIHTAALSLHLYKCTININLLQQKLDYHIENDIIVIAHIYTRPFKS